MWVNVTNVTFGSYLDHICLASNPFFSPSVSLYSDKKPGINDNSTSDGVACKHATLDLNFVQTYYGKYV